MNSINIHRQMAVGIIIFFPYVGHRNGFSIMLKDKKKFPEQFFFLRRYYYYSFSSICRPPSFEAQLFPFVKKKKKRKKTRKNPGSNKVSSRRSNIVFKHFSFVRTEKIKNKKHNVYKRVHFLVCDSPQIICNSNHDGKVFIATLSAIVYAYCDTGRYILRYLVGKLIAYQRNKLRSVDVFKRFVSICK